VVDHVGLHFGARDGGVVDQVAIVLDYFAGCKVGGWVVCEGLLLRFGDFFESVLLCDKRGVRGLTLCL
jgi:hypothetical protein